MAVARAFHFQYALCQHLDAGVAQVLANGRIEGRAIQQAFLVDRLAVAVPQHPPWRGRGSTSQGTIQSGLAQAIEHALGYALHRGEAPPLADDPHPVAQAAQA
ncbi:hypothetical protein D3C76_1509050 [compost metagenome]